MIKTEKQSREDIVKILKLLWERGHANTTGVSISERLSDNRIIVDQSGTGFRQCDISEDDLLVIDINSGLVEDAPNGAKRKAPVNVIIHTEYYKANPLARACIHCHAPYSQVFACENLPIQPYTLQSLILGNVDCIDIDDSLMKLEYHEKNIEVQVPSGLHERKDVYYVMKAVADKVVTNLSPRNNEMEKHGLAITHYQHGIFVFGRNIWESFDNLERVEANAKIKILSNLLKSKV